MNTILDLNLKSLVLIRYVVTTDKKKFYHKPFTTSMKEALAQNTLAVDGRVRPRKMVC